MAKRDGPKLDYLLLSRSRLGVLSTLIGGDEVEFTFLRDQLNLSDGNLSVQLRKLEDAKYIKIKKVFVDRKPRTICRITARGRKALEALVRHLETLVNTRP